MEALGRGGMGIVWRARDEYLHRDVAVKETTLPGGLGEADGAGLLERFIREARAAAWLDHQRVRRHRREPPEDLAIELARASSVDAEVAKLLQAQTDGIRQLDARQGAQLIREQMRAHIAHIEELHRHAVRPGVRSMLAKVLADTSSLAGWQALDVGTPRESWEHFERAKSPAREAEDPSLLA